MKLGKKCKQSQIHEKQSDEYRGVYGGKDLEGTLLPKDRKQ